MAQKQIYKCYSREFGAKEKVLNYACQTYQLSRPKKVDAVMALMRECPPQTIEERETWYFAHAHTETKEPEKITRAHLEELGGRLYDKIMTIVIPEWETAFRALTEQDCVDYIVNLTINRTFDGYIREKSVVYDTLAKHFPQVHFEESDPELDHAGDVDYIGRVGAFAFGLQIKPVTATSNFGNYSPSERMQANFIRFTQEYGGWVFIIFSVNGDVHNQDVMSQIADEIKRLDQL